VLALQGRFWFQRGLTVGNLVTPLGTNAKVNRFRHLPDPYPLDMRYILFVVDIASNSGNPEELRAIDAFNDQLQANGNWVFAAGIGDPSTATVVDFTGEHTEIKSGSLFSQNHFYSGFWIIEADTEDFAMELASQGSRACNRRVELRPFL
jgi:hypothetical protein